MSTATSTGAGILRPDQLARHSTLERSEAHPDLAPWVENHWTLTWDLPPDATFVSQTLPHPACTLSVELGHPRAGVGDDRVLVTGVITERFDVALAGSGWVHGVKFRPGGLVALMQTATGVDAGALVDRTVPATDLLPDRVVAALRSLDADTPTADAVSTAEAALLAVRPDAVDPDYDVFLAVVSDMLGDRDLLRVAQLEERHGLGRRRIERLFARYLGVGAKWVLGRYRMHDVVGELDAGYDGSLADLAARFGWYDQAHFTRDFTGLVGVSPGEYRSSSAAPHQGPRGHTGDAQTARTQ